MNLSLDPVAVALLAALLVVLLAALRRPMGRFASGCGELWQALRPDFAQFSVGRATTQTFHMLVSAMLGFGLVVVAWSAAAGVMRTLWLAGAQPSVADPDAVAVTVTHFSAVCGTGCGWSWWLLAVEVVRAVGGVMVIAMAAGIAGSLIGFIFGSPRPVAAAEAKAAGSAGAPSPRESAAGPGWELSTNLIQVADWLTKIIVGVGLVEAKGIGTRFMDTAAAAAAALFDSRHGSPALIAAAMLGSAVFGFIFGYLYMQLIVVRLFAATTSLLGKPATALQGTLRAMQAWDEKLVPRISRSRVAPDFVAQPTAAQLRAALAYAAIPFEAWVASPDVTREDVLGWARAKAVLNDYESAARGYAYLMGMVSR